jgi:methylmalonyl-CoA/ethylmalonyl-CoA epimerase
MVLGLRQVMLPAEDFDRAVAFYRDVVGLELLATFTPPGLAFFDLGGVRLLIETGTAPSTSVIYLSVDDLEAETARLRAAGAVVTGEPHLIHRDDDGIFGARGVEEWMAFFVDSEGNAFGLSERRAPVS